MRLIVIFAALLLGCDAPTTRPPEPASVAPPPPATADRSRKEEPATQPAASLAGRVVAVVDGDTIDILDADRQTIRIRLEGINAPQRGQPFGNNAKQFVSDAVFGRDVVVDGRGADRYGRTLGDVLVNGRSLNRDLVAAGLAWHYVKYSDDKH